MYTTTFGVWDYLVFGLMLVASLGIGIYHAVKGKNQTTSEYLVAGRSMTFLPVGLSLIATFQSSIMMLGTPAESYVYGFSWILAELGTATGSLLELAILLVFIKRLDLSTPYEYLERRFQSRKLRILANVLMCVYYIAYMSTVLYGQAIALQAVTGLSMYGSIGVTAGVAIVYTTIGGLKAVIWTDVLQILIMLIGLLVVSTKGTIDAGGAGNVWSRAVQSGRLDFSLEPDPTVRHTVWNLYFGRILSGFGLLFSPATMQRLSSTKSLTQSRRAILLAVPGFIFFIGIALAEGIVAYGYYSYKGCDPLLSKQIETPNQIVPFMIMDLFRNSSGMSGLFMAALSSASLSTISSCLSAVSIITYYDLFKPCWPNMSDVRGLLVAKATVVVYGAIGCFLAVLISLIGSRTLNQISWTVQSLFGSPVVGLFYLGALFTFVNTKGAITGFVTGVVFMGWLVLGSMFSTSGDHTPYYPLGPNDQCPAFNLSTSLDNMTTISNVMVPTVQYTISTSSGNISTNRRSGMDWFYSLSYTLYTSIAILVVILVGTLTSLITGGRRNRADPELVIHKTDIQFWCPPRRHVSVRDNKQETVAEHGLLVDCHDPASKTTPDFMSDKDTSQRSSTTIF